MPVSIRFGFTELDQLVSEVLVRCRSPLRTPNPVSIVVVAHAQTFLLDQLVHRVPGEKADAQPVPLRGIADLVHADSAAGAADVAHDDAANALEVFRQVARSQARIDVGRASGGVVDDHGDDPPGELLGESGVAEGKQGG
jgi:hypothetical protein